MRIIIISAMILCVGILSDEIGFVDELLEQLVAEYLLSLSGFGMLVVTLGMVVLEEFSLVGQVRLLELGAVVRVETCHLGVCHYIIHILQ